MGTKSAITYLGTVEQMLITATIAIRSTMTPAGALRPTIYAPKVTGLYAERQLYLLDPNASDPFTKYTFTLRAGKKGVFKAQTKGIFMKSALNNTLRTYLTALCEELLLENVSLTVTSMPRGETEKEGRDYFLELLIFETEDGTKIVLSLPMKNDILSPEELQFRVLELCGVLHYDLHINRDEESGELIKFALYVHDCLLGQYEEETLKKFFFNNNTVVVSVRMYVDGPRFLVSIKEGMLVEMERLSTKLNLLARIHY
jgi:hypothetical protein